MPPVLLFGDALGGVHATRSKSLPPGTDPAKAELADVVGVEGLVHVWNNTRSDAGPWLFAVQDNLDGTVLSSEIGTDSGTIQIARMPSFDEANFIGATWSALISGAILSTLGVGQYVDPSGTYQNFDGIADHWHVFVNGSLFSGDHSYHWIACSLKGSFILQLP